MNLSFKKLLLATTAFVAVSTGAHAVTDITSTLVTSTITTSNTGGIHISGTNVLVTPTSGPAIAISGTAAGDNNITIDTGSTIMAGGSAAVISNSASPASGASSGVINVSGSVIANTGKAIDLTGTNYAFTLSNSGTISGDVVLTSGADVVNLLGGSVTSLTTAGGNDTVNYFGGTVSGDINGGAGAGDVLNISGTRVWNVTGDIQNFETVNISNTTVNLTSAAVAHTITGASNINVGTGATLNVSKTISGGDNSITIGGNGIMYVTGTLNVGQNANVTIGTGSGTGGLTLGTGGHANIAGKITADNYVAATSSTLGFTVNTSTTAGQLNVLNGAANLNNTSMSIIIASNAGYIASGTSFAIVSDTGTDTSTGRLTTTQQGVYRFALSRAAGTNDVSLSIGRVATQSLVDSEAGKAVANTLDSIGNSINSGDIRTIQNTIGAQTSSAGVNAVVESLTPATDTGVGLAAINVANQSNDTINTRLAGLRGSALSGIATGDKASLGHVWMQGFGNTTNQDNRKGNAGYNANTAGATAGLDTDTLIDGVTTGAAFTYGKSNVNSKATNDAHTDIDSYMGTLYASKGFEDGYFVNGQLGYAYNKFDSSRNVIGFAAPTKGKWNGNQYSLRAEAGRDFKCNNWLLTPLASAQYTLLDQDKYTETGPAALTVNPDNLSAVDLSVGAEGGYNFAMDNGGVIRPRARAKLGYRAGDTQVQTTSNFVAGGSSFTTNGIEAGRGSVDLGAGVLLTSADGIDFSVDYDADIRNSAVGHTGQVKVKWPF